MDDSLAAMCEALTVKHVQPPGVAGAGTAAGAGAGKAAGVSVVVALRGRACQLLGALADADEHLVWVGGYPVPVRIVASAGAIDVAVHGWDVGRTCGSGAAIPGDLALNLLRIAPLLLSEADRPGRFAEPVAVPSDASPADRLLGYLGRDPGWHIHHPGTF
jgi:uncharacterized protein (TIGR03086 family)